MRRSGPLFALLVFCACAPRKAEPCVSETIELEPGQFLEENQPLKPLMSGDTVSMAQAFQGGQVFYVAARVRGLPMEPEVVVELEAWMREPASGVEVAHDLRTVLMRQVPEDITVMQPELRSRSQVAHLVLCPNFPSADFEPRNIVGEAWQVELAIEEFDVACPKRGSAQLLVVPNCEGRTPEGQALCECECAANYTVGKCR